MNSHYLIDSNDLYTAIKQKEPITVLDCRARLGDINAGKALWEKSHIPGSVHFDLGRDMAAQPGEEGRHPLPSQEAFTDVLRRLGVSEAVPIVVYDDSGGQLAAARAWWMLSCWAQHPDVRVLDGGFPAWLKAGRETAIESLPAERCPVPPGNWRPSYDDSVLVDADDIVASSAIKIDARSEERFRGEIEPIDSLAGHIPGALCRPSAANLTEEGTFKSAQQLDAELPVGEQVISYCGSGVTACHNILAYAIAGRSLPKLYVGSWSHWIRDPARPVATDE